MKKIAVWNTAFLGDAILTLPLLQSLRRAWPDAQIDYYVRGGLSGLFKASPSVTNVYEFDKRGGQSSINSMRSFGAEIRRKGYDIWLSPHPSMRSAWLAKKSGALVSIGYTRPWYNNLFYSKTVSRRFDELHEVDRILELARALGLKDISTWPEIVLEPGLRERAAEYFASLGPEPVLGMHPGSVWATKRWPTRHFASIAQTAIERGAKVMLFGGPGDLGMTEEITAGIDVELLRQKPGSLINTAGKLSLTELAAWFAKLDCYLGNDSGPMHLAAAQKVPLVTVFGPTASSLGFIPRNHNAVVVELDGLACRPCSLHGPQVCPKKHHRCMQDLLPEIVWPEVEKRLFYIKGAN